MPSAPTAPRTAPIDRLKPALAGLAVLALLAGCNTGSVREARRAAERDAEMTPMMPLQQATRLAERYFPPTPTPTPAPPLYPFVGYLAITLGVNGDGSAQGMYASVPTDAGSVYGVAELQDASEGQVITGIFTDSFGTTVGESEVTLASSQSPQWVTLPVTVSPGLQPGPYALWVFADERRIGSVAFSLTAPGNAPQMYPELPANAQVSAPTQPAKEQTKTPEAGSQEWVQDPDTGEWVPADKVSGGADKQSDNGGDVEWVQDPETGEWVPKE